MIEAQPPVIGPGDCSATDVVKLEAIILKDKSQVAVTPPAILRCGMAEALAHWVRDDVTAAVADWRGPAARGVFPLPHPSWRNTGWLKRHPWFEAELLPSLRARVREVLDV